MVLLINLLPENADEAYALIPSLKVRHWEYTHLQLLCASCVARQGCCTWPRVTLGAWLCTLMRALTLAAPLSPHSATSASPGRT